jgi:hypothetical protein
MNDKEIKKGGKIIEGEILKRKFKKHFKNEMTIQTNFS